MSTDEINYLKSINRALWLMSIMATILFSILIIIMSYGGYKLYTQVGGLTRYMLPDFDRLMDELGSLLAREPKLGRVVTSKGVILRVGVLTNITEAKRLLTLGAPASVDFNTSLTHPGRLVTRSKRRPPIFVGTHGLGKNFALSQLAAALLVETKCKRVITITVDSMAFINRHDCAQALKIIDGISKIDPESPIIWLFDEFDSWLLDPDRKVYNIHDKNMSRLIEDGGFLEPGGKHFISFAMNNAALFERDYTLKENKAAAEKLASELGVHSDTLRVENQLTRLLSFCTLYNFKKLNKTAAISFAGSNAAVLSYINSKPEGSDFSLRELIGVG